ncbi:MAG: hydroxymethylglutaryl-CoA reductase (NADPH) [Candidatus Bathyarchaeia archaeon]
MTEAEHDVDRLARRLLRGDIKPYRVEEYVDKDANAAAEVRRRAMEVRAESSLSNIGHYSIDFNELLRRNIENPIGVCQIPMGIAGPLPIDGDYAKGDFYIPLCTTEGALVASVNRGCSAIAQSGAARPKIIRDGMVRAPLLKTPSARHAYRLSEWVRENFGKVKEAAESTTRHGRLLRIDPYVVGSNVFLRMIYSTGDAMGMNMATIASGEACMLIEREFPDAKLVSVSGNLCVDKKPSAMNLIQGRGKSLVSEAVVKREVALDTLKTTPEAVVEVNWRKNYVGSALAGALGFNAHFANIIAAMYIATGQDAAQVVESSMGITTAEVVDGDLYVTVTLPSLEVGTVGGGTRLPTQREALQILGCQGGGEPPGRNAKKFAEVVSCAVLAGELSLLSALAAGHLVRAHVELGRAGVKRGATKKRG